MISEEHRKRYVQLLASYVDEADERDLLKAADLGREFVVAGLPAEDITELHEFALVRLARERSMPEMAKVASASLLLMEVMMAYSLEFRLQVEARLGIEQELRKVNDELRSSVHELEIYKRVFQALPLGISVFALRDRSDPGSLEYVLGNPAAETIGARVDSSAAGTARTLASDEESGAELFRDDCVEVVRRGKAADFGVSVIENELRGEVYLHARAFPLPEDHVGLHVEDISERRNLEEQLRQAQKMEAVGRLAGGVAHDFNNLLTAILNFAEFACERVGAESEVYQDIQRVLHSAERAAAMTRQLLSFSRKQSTAPRVLDPNSQLRDSYTMIRRLLEEDVECHTRFSDDVWNIRMDPIALEQVIINLAINARDALDRGGVLTLATDNLSVSGVDGSSDATLEPGEYVVLSVSDNGAGMSEEVQRRIFEPFFTTKDPGKGTGLGLSICLELVEQAGGALEIESNVDRGTSVRIIIPRVMEAAESVSEARRPQKCSVSGSILLAEDDEAVRNSTCRGLRERGFEVLPAASGVEALRICQTHRARLDLLLTDVVMPEMDGKELATRASSLHPEMRVLFISGYAGEVLGERGVLEDGVHLLQKPFSVETLVRRVREILDSKRA